MRSILPCSDWRAIPSSNLQLEWNTGFSWRHIEPFNFSFFSITGWGTDLDYCDIEWFALETNRDHSVIFEIASRYCILDSFVDYFGRGGWSCQGPLWPHPESCPGYGDLGTQLILASCTDPSQEHDRAGPANSAPRAGLACVP